MVSIGRSQSQDSGADSLGGPSLRCSETHNKGAPDRRGRGTRIPGQPEGTDRKVTSLPKTGARVPEGDIALLNPFAAL